ncbi:MAG: iron-containing alcohol dehydrogenase, partial [Halioglobus sp.]|nr:iron-containing alcohol dehydrogenase [Halioglobus sp.]
MVLYYRFRAFLIMFLSRILPFRSPMVLQGPGSALQLCRQVATLGFGRVLLVTDKVLREVGVIAPLQQALEEAGVQVEIYDGVLPD